MLLLPPLLLLTTAATFAAGAGAGAAASWETTAAAAATTASTTTTTTTATTSTASSIDIKRRSSRSFLQVFHSVSDCLHAHAAVGITINTAHPGCVKGQLSYGFDSARIMFIDY